MLPECKQDLWEYLAATDRPIVMYGMGNGADKILSVCAEKGVRCAESNHWRTVMLSWVPV